MADQIFLQLLTAYEKQEQQKVKQQLKQFQKELPFYEKWSQQLNQRYNNFPNWAQGCEPRKTQMQCEKTEKEDEEKYEEGEEQEEEEEEGDENETAEYQPNDLQESAIRCNWKTYWFAKSACLADQQQWKQAADQLLSLEKNGLKPLLLPFSGFIIDIVYRLTQGKLQKLSGSFQTGDRADIDALHFYFLYRLFEVTENSSDEELKNLPLLSLFQNNPSIINVLLSMIVNGNVSFTNRLNSMELLFLPQEKDDNNNNNIKSQMRNNNQNKNGNNRGNSVKNTSKRGEQKQQENQQGSNSVVKQLTPARWAYILFPLLFTWGIDNVSTSVVASNIADVTSNHYNNPFSLEVSSNQLYNPNEASSNLLEIQQQQQQQLLQKQKPNFITQNEDILQKGVRNIVIAGGFFSSTLTEHNQELINQFITALESKWVRGKAIYEAGRTALQDFRNIVDIVTPDNNDQVKQALKAIVDHGTINAQYVLQVELFKVFEELNTIWQEKGPRGIALSNIILNEYNSIKENFSVSVAPAILSNVYVMESFVSMVTSVFDPAIHWHVKNYQDVLIDGLRNSLEVLLKQARLTESANYREYIEELTTAAITLELVSIAVSNFKSEIAPKSMTQIAEIAQYISLFPTGPTTTNYILDKLESIYDFQFTENQRAYQYVKINNLLGDYDTAAKKKLINTIIPELNEQFSTVREENRRLNITNTLQTQFQKDFKEEIKNATKGTFDAEVLTNTIVQIMEPWVHAFTLFGVALTLLVGIYLTYPLIQRQRIPIAPAISSAYNRQSSDLGRGISRSDLEEVIIRRNKEQEENERNTRQLKEELKREQEKFNEIESTTRTKAYELQREKLKGQLNVARARRDREKNTFKIVLNERNQFTKPILNNIIKILGMNRFSPVLEKKYYVNAVADAVYALNSDKIDPRTYQNEDLDERIVKELNKVNEIDQEISVLQVQCPDC